MKQQTNIYLLIRSSLALALALAIWSPLHAQSAEPAQGKKMTEGKMMECCQAMKEQNQKMMAEMKAQDAALASQVAKMNSAPENEKMSLMAAVITGMVEQRTAMNACMEKMQEAMMKGMEDMGEKSADAPKDHQEEPK